MEKIQESLRLAIERSRRPLTVIAVATASIAIAGCSGELIGDSTDCPTWPGQITASDPAANSCPADSVSNSGNTNP